MSTTTVNGYRRTRAPDLTEPQEEWLRDEAALLACLMSGAQCDDINPAMFAVPANRELLLLIDDARATGLPITPANVLRAAQACGLDVDAEYIASVAAEPHTAGVEWFAGQVAKRHQERRLRGLAEGITSRLSAREPVEEITAYIGRQITPPEPKKSPIRFYTGPELSLLDVKIDFQISDFQVAGQGQLKCGPKKALKTGTEADKVISLASGLDYLGYFPVSKPIRAALMSAETGAAAIKELAHRIALSKGLAGIQDVPDALFAFDVPRISGPKECEHLRQVILEHGLQYLAIDPAYQALAVGDDGKNLFRMGELLGPLNRVMADTGCTISLSHHARKGSGREGQPLDLGDEVYSGFGEWARQWELVCRREPYDETNPGSHRLWLRWGGSAGHNGLVALDIEEGSLKDTGGRKWMVTIRDPSDIAQERREAGSEARTARKAETLAKHVRDIREALLSFPEGESSSEISIKAKLSNRDGKAALLELQSSGEAQSCKIKKNNRTYPGWKAGQPDSRTA